MAVRPSCSLQVSGLVLRYHFHLFNASEVREAGIGAGSRSLALVLHLPFCVNESLFICSDGGTTLESILRVEVLVQSIFRSILAGSWYFEATSSETVIGLLNSKVLRVAYS